MTFKSAKKFALFWNSSECFTQVKTSDRTFVRVSQTQHCTRGVNYIMTFLRDDISRIPRVAVVHANTCHDEGDERDRVPSGAALVFTFVRQFFSEVRTFKACLQFL